MNFLLDTNILIYALQRRSGEVFHDFLFQLATRGMIFISVINRFEVLAGSLESLREQNKAFLDDFLLLELTQSMADHASLLFCRYKKKGITVDNEDLFLTATALEKGLNLVTTNVKHFPDFFPKEQHLVTFSTQKGLSETKNVFILTPKN